MPKQKSRTMSKAEREMTSYLRLQNMSSFIEAIDAKLSNIEDDLSLLLALDISTKKDGDSMRKQLRDAAKSAIEPTKEDINESNES